MSEDGPFVQNETNDKVPGFDQPVVDTARGLLPTDLSWPPPDPYAAAELGYDRPYDEQFSRAVAGFQGKLSQHSSKPFIELTDTLASGDDPATQAAIAEILNNQSLNGKPVPKIMGKWGYTNKAEKIVRFLSIYEQDQALAETLIDKSVYGFHASSSAALYGILEEGALLPAQDVRRQGKPLRTGERTFSPHADGDDSISFADWRAPDSVKRYAGLDIRLTLDDLRQDVLDGTSQLERYHEILADGSVNIYARNLKRLIAERAKTFNFVKTHPDSLESKLILANFPIAYGVNIDGLPEHEDMYGKQDETKLRVNRTWPGDVTGEFTVRGGALSLDRIPIIATTKEYQQELQIMLEEHGYKDKYIADINILTSR